MDRRLVIYQIFVITKSAGFNRERKTAETNHKWCNITCNIFLYFMCETHTLSFWSLLVDDTKFEFLQ